jgi:hypothetical protein
VVTVVANGGGATPSASAVDDSSSRCTSSSKNGSRGSLTSYSPATVLQLLQMTMNLSHMKASLND